MLGPLHDANSESASCPGCGRASVLQLLNTVVGDRRRRRSCESLPIWCHWCVACVLDTHPCHCCMLMLGALHDAASCPGCGRASVLQLLNTVVGDRRRRRSRESLPSWCHWCAACVLDTHSCHCFMLMLGAVHDANSEAASCPGCERASCSSAKDSGGRQEAAEKSREPAELVPLVRCVCSRHTLLPLLHVDARSPA